MCARGYTHAHTRVLDAEEDEAGSAPEDESAGRSERRCRFQPQIDGGNRKDTKLDLVVF